jgi:hypothetical protein
VLIEAKQVLQAWKMKMLGETPRKLRRLLIFSQEPTKLVNMSHKVVLSNNFKGFVVKYHQTENVKVAVTLDPWIEGSRYGPDVCSVAISRKLCMKGLSASCIYGMEKGENEVTAISSYLIRH